MRGSFDAGAAPKIQGYPTATPEWKPVPDSRLGTYPYARICQVGMRQGNVMAGIGSGWFAAPGKILTAAHVAVAASGLHIRLAGEAGWHAVSAVSIAPGYIAPDGRARPCSEADLALLAVPSLASLSSDEPVFEAAAAVAVGFSAGRLVEHGSTARAVGPFTAHNCHTDHEHSGCPLFVAGRLAAVHVGLFAGSRVYLTPPASSVRGYLNSAVTLTGGQADALGITGGQ